MPAKADLTAQIAALNRVLAEATKECPCHQPDDGCGPCDVYKDGGHAPACDGGCQGTGRVARFPSFRQECQNYICQQSDLWGGVGYVASGGPGETKVAMKDPDCNGTGWQVHAGGLEDGLAGLGIAEGIDVLRTMCEWLLELEPGLILRPDAPMPSAAVILAEGLRLVCAVAGLEVPDAF